MNCLGGNGFGATMERRRYLLPGEIVGKYLHKKTYSSDKTKVARFFNPVVATNNTEKAVETRTCDYGDYVEHVIRKAFQCVQLKFKSISSCNISTANVLNSFKMSARKILLGH